MVGGNSDKNEASSRLGLPADLIGEAEGYRDAGGGIYPDNAQTVAIFSDMLTQWRVGATGATGLDYAALPAVFSIRHIKREDRADVFDGLQVMERAALEAMREQTR
jgi:hypothetical protein